MIIKLIDKKEGAKGALRYARNLATYMADPDPRRLQPDAAGLDYGLTLSAYMGRKSEIERGRNEPPRERVLYRGALVGGAETGWDDGVAEMERRLERRSSRVKKPARHGVLSYRFGEHPTEEECQEAIAILTRELGCEAAAILWAAHADTDNVHIHVLFVTVDPDTGAALPFGQGADGRANHKEAMQRAIARIEHAQRLQAEAGSRYDVIDGHVVRKPEHMAPTPTRKRTPLRQEILAFEDRSGFASFTRVGQDVAGPVLDEARSWQELHRDLATHGIGIRPKDNGGELHAGEEHVKLSNVDRRHSWFQLIKPDRLGPYVAPEGVDLAHYEPRILDETKAAAWLKRRDTEQAIASRIEQRVAALLAARDAALAELKASIAEHSNDLERFDGDARLRRDVAAAWPRIGADAMAALGAAFDARIAAVRALRHAVAGADDLDAIDLDGIGEFEAGMVVPWHGDAGVVPMAVIDGYEAERSGDVVRYWTLGDRRHGQPAMVDAGAVIWVNDTSNGTIAAAIRLAQHRFENVAVFGDAAYLRQCAAVAEQLGIPITVIPVAEGQRRARKTGSSRTAARRRALDTQTGDRNSAVVKRRRWRDAYRRAMSTDDRYTANDGAAVSAAPEHHASLPLLESLSRRDRGTPRSNAVTPSRRFPSPETGIE